MNDLHNEGHSLAHVMVLAIRRLYDDNILRGVGPSIENGFYQDFHYKFSSDDLPKIEEEMRKIIKEDLEFIKEESSIDEAIDYYKNLKQKYKVELLEDIKTKGSSKINSKQEDDKTAILAKKGIVTFYSVGSHKDLCRGGHVNKTSELKNLGFKLDRIAGAYWRGSEKNPMLTRIYGVVFSSNEELNKYYTRLEEAKKRDHKKIGLDQDLFFFHDTAPGNTYWLPKGLIIKNLLIELSKQYHKENGYVEVSTPIINKKALYVTSGHWKYYKDDMFISEVNDDLWMLKPMNCPCGMNIFKLKPRSYKDLPLRLFDLGILHRNEVAGSLNGLLRPREFIQDDSHNFVGEDQIKEEILNIMKLIKDLYSVFGLADSIKLYLSTRPDDFMGDISIWNNAEEILKKILLESGFKFQINEKDGAFYGPKIDIKINDALGREWQCGTMQLDFQLPINFALQYIEDNGKHKTPIVIHKVIYGSIERFMGILTEHLAGHYPFWLSPVQVKVLTVNDKVSDYLGEIECILKNVVLNKPVKYNALRYEIDDSNERLSKKIRIAQLQKIPVIIIIGPKDKQNNKVSIRIKENESEISVDQLDKYLLEVNI